MSNPPGCLSVRDAHERAAIAEEKNKVKQGTQKQSEGHQCRSGGRADDSRQARLAAKDLAAAKERIADHRSISECEGRRAGRVGWRGRSPGTAAGEQADERCCLGAPPTADFNAENDKVATPRADQLRVRPLFASAGGTERP